MDCHEDLRGGPEAPVGTSLGTIHRMGEVLEELLAQFQRKFPHLGLSGMEPPTTIRS